MIKLELLNKNNNKCKYKIFILDDNRYIRDLKYEAAKHILDLVVMNLTEEEDMYEILDTEELTNDDIDLIMGYGLFYDINPDDIFTDKPYITIL